MNSNTTEQTPKTSEADEKQQSILQPVIHLFELAIYDVVEDDNGNPINYKPVSYPEPVIVTASSKAELQSKLSTFKLCNLIAKVVRELNPPPKLVIQEQTTNQEILSFTSTNSHCTENAVKQSLIALKSSLTLTQKTKPRYFKIGDLDVKEDNGIFYLKQWMKVTESEASNIRIVNDKNNATVSLNGKHIEIKKWIRVENTAEDDSIDMLMESVN